MKESITPDDVCDLLNELLSVDYDSIYELVTRHVECNQALVDHETVQVRGYAGPPSVGMMGIINGMFGVNQNGHGPICYEIENGKILKFRLFKKP